MDIRIVDTIDLHIRTSNKWCKCQLIGFGRLLMTCKDFATEFLPFKTLDLACCCLEKSLDSKDKEGNLTEHPNPDPNPPPVFQRFGYVRTQTFYFEKIARPTPLETEPRVYIFDSFKEETRTQTLPVTKPRVPISLKFTQGEIVKSHDKDLKMMEGFIYSGIKRPKKMILNDLIRKRDVIFIEHMIPDEKMDEPKILKITQKDLVGTSNTEKNKNNNHARYKRSKPVEKIHRKTFNKR
jgi:hypothetical protein